MKKLPVLILTVLGCATAAFAAPPGRQVVKVSADSITLHWQVEKVHTTRHGEAGGGYGSGSREFTFRVTPQTTYWQGGKQVTLGNVQKGETVKVTANNGVISRLDIL
jgi:hypothetical protein